MSSVAKSGSKACAICHRRKVKCDLANGVSPCTNCKRSDYPCRPHVRKRARYHNAQESINEAFATPQTSHVESLPTPVQQQTVRSRIYLGRSEYIGGDIPFTEDEGAEEEDRLPRHSDPGTAPPILPRSTRASLIDAFMERCYPWMPIVERSWLEPKEMHPKETLLNYATFLAGSRVSSVSSSSQSSSHFYDRARSMFFAGAEHNPMLALIVTCLLQWWSPTGPEQISLDTSGFWASTGAFLSYQVGLHIDPGDTPDNGLRRRLWWTLRSRDSLISVAVGRPRIINTADSSVRVIALSDFPVLDNNAHLFCAYAPICSLLGDIAEAHRRHKLDGPTRKRFEERLVTWSKSIVSQHQLFAMNAERSLAKYSFEAWQLWVPYLMSIIVLERTAEKSSSHASACLLASSIITAIFEDFSARDHVQYLGPVWAFYALTAGLCQLTGYRYITLRPIAEKEITTLRIALEQLASRWGSARRALRSLAKAQETVEQHAPLDALPNPPSDRMESLFDCFGPALCRMWYLRRQDRPTSHPADLVTTRERDARDMDAALLLSNLPGADGAQPSDLAIPHDISMYGDAFGMETLPGLDTTFQPPGSWLFDDFEFGLPGFDT